MIGYWLLVIERRHFSRCVSKITNDQSPITNDQSPFPSHLTIRVLRKIGEPSGRIDCYDRSADRVLTRLRGRVEFRSHVDSLRFRYSDHSILSSRCVMAAPQNKPIGYQVAVIVLSLGIVILGTLVYMDLKQIKQVTEANNKSIAERQTSEKLERKVREEFEDLKKITGNPGEDYGLSEEGNLTKVRAANLADIDKAGVAERTHKAAINSLKQKADELEKDKAKARDDLAALQKTLEDLRGVYQVQVNIQSTGREKADGDLSVAIKNKDEEVRAKQKRIDELTQAANEAATELENEKAARAAEIKQLDVRIAKLTAINIKYRRARRAQSDEFRGR